MFTRAYAVETATDDATGGATRDVEGKAAEQEWRIYLTAVDVPQKDQIVLQTSCFQTGDAERAHQLIIGQSGSQFFLDRVAIHMRNLC